MSPPPSICCQLPVKPFTSTLRRRWSLYAMARWVSIRPPAVRMVGSRWSASASVSVSRGWRKNVQALALERHALLRPEGRDRVQPRGAAGGIHAGNDAHASTDADAEDDGPQLDGGW